MTESKLYFGNCLEIMPLLPDESIDLILCDLPYGTGTAHKWNQILPISLLWEEYERLIKKDGVICLFGLEPFTSEIICSKKELFRYMWLWEKESPTGYLNANYKPLNAIEEIAVFSKATVGSLSKVPIPFHPPTLVPVNKKKLNRENSTWRERMGYCGKNNILNTNKEYIQKYTNYPTSILSFDRDKTHYHPTQKPVKLLEFLIETYTQEKNIVMDNCMGSGSTGVACKNTKRSFIGIEKEYKYYKIAERRILRV